MRKLCLLTLFLMHPLFLIASEPKVIVKNMKECHTLIAGGGFTVKELIHRKNDGVDPGFSIAYVELKPGKITKPHRLLTSSQVYYILKGKAVLHLNSKEYLVKPGDVIYIAPGVIQWAENKSNSEFAFICVVSPPWRKADEEVLN